MYRTVANIINHFKSATEVERASMTGGEGLLNINQMKLLKKKKHYLTKRKRGGKILFGLELCLSEAFSTWQLWTELLVVWGSCVFVTWTFLFWVIWSGEFCNMYVRFRPLYLEDYFLQLAPGISTKAAMEKLRAKLMAASCPVCCSKERGVLD